MVGRGSERGNVALCVRSSSFLHTVHIMPRCHAPNPCLKQQQDTVPYVVKKPQSCTPEDGQKFAQNMLSWSWRSIKLLLLHLVGFYITLPTLMMHGQTQIKFTTNMIPFQKHHPECVTWVGTLIKMWVNNTNITKILRVLSVKWKIFCKNSQPKINKQHLHILPITNMRTKD